MKHKDIKTVVIATIVYKNFTGVELYIYELSRELAKRGSRVIIIAPEIGGEIVRRTQELNIQVYDFENCPDIEPDILHLNEPLPTMFALARWPNVPAIATIHSQFIVEKPVLANRIHTYVCIRKEIQQKLIKEYGISKNRTKLIHNGFDFDRFSNGSIDINANIILFVGTIDPLRRKSIEHLIERTKQNGEILYVIGKKYADYLDSPPQHVKVFPSRWDIEDILKNPSVKMTAGVLLGRTTIEGWISGKPGIIYNIDLEGDIISHDVYNPPEDIDKFNIVKVTESILEEYQNAIKEYVESDGHDLNLVVSSMISRSISQGIMLHEMLQRFENMEHRVSSLEHGSSSLHSRIGIIESKIPLRYKMTQAFNKFIGK